MRSNSLPFATEFSAQPPASDSLSSPVRLCRSPTTWKKISSYTTCALCAMSAHLPKKSGSSASRAGPSSSASFGENTLPIWGDPSSQVISTPSLWWRK